MADKEPKVVKSSKKVVKKRGPKTGERRGGRVKGTPNKKTASITEKLEAMGCDPLGGMAKIAAKAMKEGDFPLAGSMFKELAQYVAPKRKAVEITGQDGAPIETTSSFNFVPVGADH